FAFDPNGKVISVNTTGATKVSAADAAGTSYGGATPILSAQTPVTPGTHSLYLSIFDQGDAELDSAVFVDNLVLGQAAGGACTKGATTNPGVGASGPGAPPTGTPSGGTVLVGGTPYNGGPIAYGSTVDVTKGRLLVKTDAGTMLVYG